MSQLITLTTKNNGVFQNYFEDTIKIPAHSEVAFIKAIGLNMAYNEYNYITVPKIDGAFLDINILRVNIDGVNVAITWNMLRTATNKLRLQADEVAVTEEVFFSGDYKWSIDPKDPGNIVDSICEALNSKLLFYHISPNCAYSRETLNGDAKITHFGLTSNYVTHKRMSNKNQDFLDKYLKNIGNLTTYCGTATLQAGSIVTTATDTIVYSSSKIAINGGFVQFSLNSDKEVKVGVSFSNMGQNNNTTGTNQDLDFDFGIHYKFNGTGTYSVIRDGVETDEVLGTNGAPSNRPNDAFNIVFTRTAEPESTKTTGYTAFLLQGYDALSGSDDWHNFIVARHEMSGGYCPTFMFQSPDADAKVVDIKIIPAEIQDLECRSFMDYLDDTGGEISGGTAYRNCHSFFLKNSENMDELDRNNTRKFFVSLGFVNWCNERPRTYVSYPMVSRGSNQATQTPLIIKSRLEGPVESEKDVTNLRSLLPTGDIVTGNAVFSYLQLHMDDLNIISFEGNEPNGRQQNTATKILTNLDLQDDVLIDDNESGGSQLFKNYDYEAFNPIYITLHNTEELNINQIRARLVGPKNEEVQLAKSGDRSIIMIHIRKEQSQ